MKFIILIISISLSACSSSPIYKDKSFERTLWLSSNELKNWSSLRKAEGYWKKGHWVIDIEGRSTQDKDLYRITMEKAPSNRKYYWYWWYGQSLSQFKEHEDKLTKDGFIKVSESIFTSINGTPKKNGVWHKVE